jgi:FMN-dependent NADH-azoreductase
MTRILRIDVSPKGAKAHSRRFADIIVRRLIGRDPAARIIHRDLAAAASVPSFVDEAFAAAMGQHTTHETARNVPALVRSELLITELEGSDIVVLSTPMHNFTVPAALKAWIDQVVRVGRTFEVTPAGKIGKLRDRPVYVAIASGGYFSGEAARQPDFLTPYLRAILATIGLKDLQIFALEGVTRGDAALAAAYEKAEAALDRVLPE